MRQYVPQHLVIPFSELHPGLQALGRAFLDRKRRPAKTAPQRPSEYPESIKRKAEKISLLGELADAAMPSELQRLVKNGPVLTDAATQPKLERDVVAYFSYERFRGLRKSPALVITNRKNILELYKRRRNQAKNIFE